MNTSLKVVLLTAMLMILAVGVIWSLQIMSLKFVANSLLSGWLLLTVLLLLFAMPLLFKILRVSGSVKAQQITVHTVLALFLGYLFAIHLNFKLPTGVFETLLASMFVLVWVAGVLMLLTQPWLNRNLVREQDNNVFDNFDHHRNTMRHQIEKIVFTHIEQTRTQKLLMFYLQYLKQFVDNKHSALFYFLHYHTFQLELKKDINALRGFLPASDQVAIKQLENLISKKLSLEHRYHKRNLLRCVIYLHIPLSYALLVAVALHWMIIDQTVGSLW